MQNQPMLPQSWWPANFGMPRSAEQFLENFFHHSDSAGGDVIVPRMDVTESDKAYELVVEMPGVSDKGFDVTIADGMLTIKGEKHSEKRETDDKKNVIRAERAYGSFYRSMSLPADSDEAKITASNKDGVLRITIPKAANGSAKSRKVEIRKD